MAIEILLMYLKVFAVGGAICTIAQLIINYTKLTAGRILVYFLLSGVFLQAIGLYQYLVDFAGAGATVPIVGFGHTLAQGVERAVAQNGFTGIFTGGLTACSGGVSASLIFGFIAAVCTKSKSQS